MKFQIKSIGILLVSTLVLTFAFRLGNLVSGIEGMPLGIWHLLSSLLAIICLFIYLSHANARGKNLIIDIFVIYFVLGHLSILIEAYLFNVLDGKRSLSELLSGLIGVAIIAPAIVYLSGLKHGEARAPKSFNFSKGQWIRKILYVILLYVFFYTIAGMIVQASIPNFMDFYDGKIPPFQLVIGTQLARGLIFALIGMLILRSTHTVWLSQAVLVGLLFAFLGAIVPLIVPNDNMPQYIRIAHGFEVGISNFIFGWLTGRILQPPGWEKK